MAKASRRTHGYYVLLAGAISLIGLGVYEVYASRNRLSDTSILGRWSGYFLQKDATGQMAHVPLTMEFRPNGFVKRGYGRADANYLVHGHTLVFYHIRSRNAPSYPVVYESRLVGDTLTIGTGLDASILKKIR